MRILIFNWRDPKNPRAGGAEVLTRALARRWVMHGHAVTWFASTFRGARRQEELEGIHIVRGGGPWSVYWRAYQYYRRGGQHQWDVIVDEVNTVPFFSVWYAGVPVVLHFNQLAREVWFYECAWPVAVIGRWLETAWLRWYRQRPVITISESGKRDLIRLGFSPDRITVVPMGLTDSPPPVTAAREADPTVLFVGRLKRSKRVDHVIRALAAMTEHPEVTLWIIGDGDAPYRRALERLARRIGVADRVAWFGSVSEADKHRFLQRAHVLAVPSVREGWGLVVTEANHWGTPAVVYPVAGLVDSTADGVTGLVCPGQHPAALADGLRRVLADRALWQRLSDQAKASVRKDAMDCAAEMALAVLARAQ